MYISPIPIPPATPDQQRWCERLAEALIWLHGPEVRKAKDESSGLMVACFEQWLNGLVYELFFPGEFHTRKLKLFDETTRLNPPDLAQVPEPRKLAALQEVFTKAYDSNATLRGMLFDVHELDVVRVIEDAPNTKEERTTEGNA